MKCLFPRVVALLLGLAVCRQSVRAAEITYVPAILTGDSLPGLPGETFNGFGQGSSPVAINGSGQVGFFGVTNQRSGIWVGLPGAPQAVALTGSPAPDVGGSATFSSFAWGQHFALNDAGQVAFAGNIMDGSRQGIWMGAPGDVRLVAVEGAETPARPGFRFSHFNGFVWIDQSGKVAFEHGSVDSIWEGRPGSAVPVSFGGQVNFTSMNDSGQLVFVRGSPQEIWTGTASSLQLVARAGTFAPGFGGRPFEDLRYPRVNGSGNVVFTGVVEGGENGLWFGMPSRMQLLMKTGSPAPGTASTIQGIGVANLSDGGHIAFFGSFPDRTMGLWAGKPGDFRLVLREGMQAPGMAEGVVFAGDPNFPAILNDVGQVLIHVGLRRPGMAGTMGLWATTPDRELVAVAVVGETIDLGGGDLRTISEIGQRYAINDAGQVAFKAFFTDGSSGVIVAQVPEPGAMFLLCAAAVVMRRPRVFARGR